MPIHLRKKKVGFSLPEILVAVAILGVVLASAGANLRKTSVTTHGVAVTIAAAMTELRQQAIAQGAPVALVVPSGSDGQADGYYVVTGHEPRISRIQKLEDPSSQIRLMVGHWPLDPAKTSGAWSVTPWREAEWESAGFQPT